MKTMLILKWDGVTPSQYEEIRKQVNWERNKPHGAIFHVASFGNGAMHVTDIWESADDFNDFVQKRLMPSVTAAGIKSAPQVETYPVHAIVVQDSNQLN